MTPNAAGWSAPMLFALGLLAAGTAFTARVFQRQSQTTAGPPTRRLPAQLLAWTPTVAMAVLGAAASVGSASPTGLTAFWCLVAVEELATALPWLRRRIAGPNENRMLGERANGELADDETANEAFSSEALSSEALTQRLVRTRTAEGGERVVGWLRVDLSPGQRTAAAHVSFCPPLARAPSIEVAQTSGPSAQIKTLQPLPYGVRFEARLSQPVAQPSSLLIRFEAFSPLADPTPSDCPPRA